MLRDVNGDNALDLVVTTAWLNRPVAVLVNDGHGNFAVSDPGSFPAALGGSEAVWKDLAVTCPDLAAVAVSGTLLGDAAAHPSEATLPKARRQIPRAPLGGLRPVSVSAALGRAPPTSVL